MSQVQAISLQALQNDSAALDRISTNVANLLTPGYRREMSVQSPVLPIAGMPGVSTFAAAMAAGRPAASDTPPSTSPAAIHYDTARHGTIKTTGAPLDVALLGGGFFEVETANGPAYTRDGQFRLDARGTLVTAQGQAVQGRSGHITLAPGAVTINAAGQVLQDGRAVGKLKVMDLEDAGSISHVEGGLYETTVAPRPLADADIEVRQGALENSNVDHLGEMVQMMQVARHFEAMTKAIQGSDDMTETAIRQLGQF